MESTDTDAARAVLQLLKLGKHEEAFRAALQRAEQGSQLAQVQVGWMSQTGTGTPVDVQEAERWYRKGSEHESGSAEFYLGTLFRAKQEPRSALEAFEASARKGYAPASYRLGRMYLFGEGVTPDERRAHQYFEEAAERGHLYARRNRARRMMSGALGLREIPAGIVSMVSVLWTVWKIGSNEDSELMLRL
jgi:TPR repeat protein